MTPMPPINSFTRNRCHQQISFLANANSSAVTSLCPIERRLPRRGTLFHDGDQLNYLYEVASGMIRTSRHFADGRRQLLDFFSVGEFVGTPYARMASCAAEAVVATTVLCYPVSQVTATMAQSVSLTRTVLKAVHQDAERQMDHIMMLSRRCPDERVAAFLLKYCSADDASVSDRPTILLPMSRVDIADYLGLSQETVCRVLARLKQAGIIDVDGRNKLTVNNVSMLQNFSESGADIRHRVSA